MKHLVFAIASVLAVAAWADTESAVTPVAGADSVQVDVVKYVNPPQHAIVAVRAASLADGGAVSVHDYVKTSTLDEGTVLYVFDGAGYQSYQLTKNNGAKVWTPATVALPGKVTVTEPSGDLTLSVGTAFWIWQPNTPTRDIVIYGAPVVSGVTELAKGRTLVPNLAASAVNVANLITGAATADQIILPDGKRYTYNGKAWGRSAAPGQVEYLPPIPAGGGFWYMANGDEVKINWSPKAP